jgi:WD40 repeat protein
VTETVDAPPSPYKGLASYGESGLDPVLFFGREREIEVIVANLVATRLTILYGPSGVGKTSVLQAGVAPRLRREGAAVLLFSSWSSDVLKDLVDQLRKRPDDHAPSELHVVLDQFEEFFLYHDTEGPFGELAQLISDREVRANFLISVREDALAQLDAFKTRVPNLFGNFLRLDRLDRRAATRAILGPLERYAELESASGPVRAEPELVDEILDSVTAGRIVLGVTGRGSAEVAGKDDGGIEAPYLQLVLARLWEVEREHGSDMLRRSTLRDLGGAAHIVEEHLERAMSSLSGTERDAAAAMYNHLVTPSGTKIALGAGDLARYAAIDEEEAGRVLNRLADERIVRMAEDGGSGRHYEIFHDVLADAVLGWRAKHEAERQLATERRESARRHRRLLALSASSLVAMAVLAAVAVYALTQRSQARENARNARAGELVAQAAAVLPGDPQKSLELAVRASGIARGVAVEQVLRKGLRQLRGLSVTRVPDPPGEVALGRHGSLVAVAAGNSVRLYGNGGSRPLVALAHPKVESAAISAGGSRIVTVGRDEKARVWTRTGRLVLTIPHRGQVQMASFSPDGRRVATVSRQRVIKVFDLRGRQRGRFGHRSRILSLRFSPDGALIATGAVDQVARIWNAETGRVRQTLGGHLGRVGDVVFSPDGQLVATGSTDGTARVWRLDGTLVTVMPGHENAVARVEFSPDGTLLATGSRDRRARIFESGSPTLRATLAGHARGVTDLVWTRDGATLTTTGEDMTVRRWDGRRFPALPLERVQRGGVGYVLFDGTEGIRSWPPGPTDPRIGAPQELAETIRASSAELLALSPDRQLAVSGDKEGVVRLWDAETRTPLRSLPPHRSLVKSARFSPDGRYVVTTGDHDAQLSEVETGRQVWVLPHPAVVSDADFSADGRWVFVAGPGEAGVVDAQSGERLMTLDGKDRILTSIDASPAGWRIVTGGERGAIRTYDCRLCGGLDELEDAARQRLEQLRPTP